MGGDDLSASTRQSVNEKDRTTINRDKKFCRSLVIFYQIDVKKSSLAGIMKGAPNPAIRGSMLFYFCHCIVNDKIPLGVYPERKRGFLTSFGMTERDSE